TDGLRLSADFDAHREALFTLIRDLGGDGEGAYFYPSDLAKLDGLNDDERAELYDNLLFHGYLDPSGAVLRPDVFADPDGAAAFPRGPGWPRACAATAAPAGAGSSAPKAPAATASAGVWAWLRVSTRPARPAGARCGGRSRGSARACSRSPRRTSRRSPTR